MAKKLAEQGASEEEQLECYRKVRDEIKAFVEALLETFNKYRSLSMINLKIYDPAMCCSSGVCGPNINEKLVHLSAFLKGLDKSSYKVERYNLSQQPEAYVSNQDVANMMQEKGIETLPLIFVDDKLVCSGDYPATDELANLLRIDCENVETAGSDCCSGGCCQ